MDPLDTLRWKLLTVLHSFIAFCAIAGGGALAVWPTGVKLGLTLSQLQGSPFTSFVIPGLLLYGAVGVHHAMAAYLVFKREPGAEWISFSSALALLGYLAGERLFVRDIHWLQYAFGGLAALVLIQAVILRLHRPHAPVPPLAGAQAH